MSEEQSVLSLLPTLRGHLSIDSPSSTILCRTSFEEICQLMTVSFRAQNATYQTRRQEVIIVAKEIASEGRLFFRYLHKESLRWAGAIILSLCCTFLF